ncbi:MAG: DUF481 domain-containing protein [Bdellovibrionaceae bacterium]|nr:DUF481 domain-containing protein [Pseudobdellovibrionaceae bacterium]
MRIVAYLLLMVLTSFAYAQEQVSSWANESEASVVQVGGNKTSESYSAKQKTTYKAEANLTTILGRYLQTRSSGTETAKQWEAAARYERELTSDWAAFIQQKAESDTYAGYLQRDISDVGIKYYFIKNPADTFFGEVGLGQTKTISSPTYEVSSYNSGRVYLEYGTQINESVSAKFWAEYSPNFKDSEAYLLNYEPSMSVMMSQIFSIKLSYLVKYQNRPPVGTAEKEDTAFTTALVAKF